MAETQKIVILNFGGQYTQLIARRVRECHVYSCVLPYDASLETIRAQNPVGVSSPAARRACWNRMPPAATRACISWVCRCWASVTECS